MRAAYIGALVGALATLPGLGAGTLWDNSETAYGEVAREILLFHDWTVMHLNGHPWYVQPPLYFWIAAISARILGITAFALRLPSALATAAMGAAVAYAVAREAGERAGIFACVILSSALMQAVIGRLAIMDALLDLSVTVTILAWYRGLQTGRDRPYLIGAAAAALGFLAKGPVAPVAALLVVLPYAYWSRMEIRLPRARTWLWGCGVFAAITLPWFVALVARTSPRSVLELIGHYTFGRYTGVIENQSGPAWYYVPVLILGFFPWIAFLPPAVAYGVKRARSGALWRLGFAWIVVPFLFFSFAQTKLPNYVALELPGLALVTALYFDAVARKGATRSAIVAAAIVPLTIGCLALAIRIFTLDNKLTEAVSAAVPALLGAAILIFAGSLVTAILLARRLGIASAPLALGMAMLAAVDLLAVAVLPYAEAFKPIPRFAAVIDRYRRPGDIVAIQNVSGSNALVFYTRPGVYALGSPDASEDDAIGPRLVICNAPRVWVVEPREPSGLDPSYGRSRFVAAAWMKDELVLYDGAPCAPRATLRPASR